MGRFIIADAHASPQRGMGSNSRPNSEGTNLISEGTNLIAVLDDYTDRMGRDG